MANSYDSTKVPKYGASAGLFNKAVAASPDNDNDLAVYARLILATDGTVCFVPARNDDGATVTMTLKAGQTVPFLVRRLMATGTSATLLVANAAN